MSNNFLCILSFLKKYSGNQYKSLEKCATDQERNYMIDGSTSGKEARAAFGALVESIQTKYGFVHDRITQWQNSGTFVSYFWCQMKRADRKYSQISISLFAEKAVKIFRFRLSVELAVDNSKENDILRYKRLLDIPLDPKLVYVSGGNNDSEFRILNERDNDVVKQMGLKKVQISYIYNEDQFTDDESLEIALLDATELLNKYYDSLFNDQFNQNNHINTNDIWWPSKSEYNPGFTVEQWTEMMTDPEYLENPWRKILAMFYAEKDGASCKQIGDKYGIEPSSVRSSSMQLAQRIYLRKNCPIIEVDGKRKLWPILFFGRDAKPDEKGSFVWKLRPELYEALTKVNILQWLPQLGGEAPIQMNLKETIARVKEYIAGKGFTYEDGLIDNFWLSLKSKPFVILAGTSGTGKTRLVKLFAEAIEAEYRLVPVRPDWSDSSDLLGHHNLAGEFVPGQVLNIILEAMKEPEKPYILCLDEMNLARVEYYLSDFLSVIETRDLKDGRIVSDRLLPFEYYGDISFPENLYLVGTVNMDETTFPFSKKVLDRANTIEFNTVDLIPPEIGFDLSSEPLKDISNGFLKTEYLFLGQCMDEENREFITDICTDLEAVNKILQEANLHVGYRVRDEIVFYMLNNRNAALLDRDAAFDNEIMQKILPRIQGSTASVKKMLCELFKYSAGDFEGYQTESNDTAAGMLKRIRENGAKYPRSAAKIAFMVRRFDEDGFTSYWL